MVRSLAKDGNHILARRLQRSTCSTRRLHLMVKRQSSWKGGLPTNVDNIFEELGTIEFYAEGTRQGRQDRILHRRLLGRLRAVVCNNVEPDMPVLGVVIATGKIYDIIKGHCRLQQGQRLPGCPVQVAFREYDTGCAGLTFQSTFAWSDVRDANMRRSSPSAMVRLPVHGTRCCAEPR